MKLLEYGDMKGLIYFLHTTIRFLGRLRLDLALKWQVLAILQATLSIWVVQETQQDQGITLLTVVVWGGAAICIEDELEGFQVRPSLASLLAGTLLLTYATWRSLIVLDLDSVVYVLPLLQGVGLVLMARPVRQLFSLKPALIVLSLFPLQFLAFKLLPEYWLSVSTGKIGQIILQLLSINAVATGRLLSIGSAGVSIQPACSGAGQIAGLTVTAIVFVMAYPIKSGVSKACFLVMAPLIGYLVNACRIIILALIISSNWPQKDQLFDFFHEEWGGLVFSGIATVILGQIYMSMVDQQLNASHD